MTKIKCESCKEKKEENQLMGFVIGLLIGWWLL